VCVVLLLVCLQVDDAGCLIVATQHDLLSLRRRFTTQYLPYLRLFCVTVDYCKSLLCACVRVSANDLAYNSLFTTSHTPAGTFQLLVALPAFLFSGGQIFSAVSNGHMCDRCCKGDTSSQWESANLLSHQTHSP